ncbi:MAG: hypothetical protein U0176_07710 [Bacteroidia bacterium]
MLISIIVGVLIGHYAPETGKLAKVVVICIHHQAVHPDHFPDDHPGHLRDGDLEEGWDASG